MSQSERRFARSSRTSWRFNFLVVLLLFASCGLIPERVSAGDPRLKPMFEAIGRVDRTRLPPPDMVRLITDDDKARCRAIKRDPR